MKPYPKPSPMGGRLIRQVVGLFKTAGLEIPFKGPVFLAVSGGPDSLAMAHLLIRYGRRIALSDQFQIIHINHHWRGAQSDKEMQRVMRFAKGLKTECQIFHLSPEHLTKGKSPEDAARQERKRVFDERLKTNPDSFIFTAHHRDDLAETLLWRFCTGQIDTHGEGIRFQNEQVLRPLLLAKKTELIQYLNEEKVKYSIDPTNQDPRYLRGKIRKHLTPALDLCFPAWVDRISQYALSDQGLGSSAELQTIQAAIAKDNPRARRSQIQEQAKQVLQARKIKK